MTEEKTIRINMELPVSELAGVTSLLEQLRQLMADHRQLSAAPTAAEQNASFDAARFQALQEKIESVHPLTQETDGPPADSAVEIGGSLLPQPETTAAAADSSIPSPPKMLPVRFESFATAEKPAQDMRRISEATEAAVPAFTEPPETTGRSRTASSAAFATEPRSTAAQPVTAEALSLAFRRDDRRYDNGFPLY